MADKQLNSNDSIIYVGNKQPMKYVLGVVTQFQNGSEEVFVKARGRLISKAVDVVEILRNKLMKEVNVNNIETSTQKITGDKGDVNVSVISIRLLK